MVDHAAEAAVLVGLDYVFVVLVDVVGIDGDVEYFPLWLLS